MGREIERKFLVAGDSWRRAAGVELRQGYLIGGKKSTVRVRILGERGFLTVKGPTVGATRLEYEYEIPLSHAEEMLAELCEKPLIEKTRYRVPSGGLVIEVDEFLGENRGLIVAEIELESECQPFRKPDWLGEEVTGDPRYYNSNLTRHPFKEW